MVVGRGIAWMALVALFSLASGRGIKQLPLPMHTLALKSVDYVFHEQFDKALEAAREVIRAYPSHPAGYFLYAAGLDAWMARYRTNSKEDEFYRYCDDAVEKAEALADKGKDGPWSTFFLGGAVGLKANYEMRYERWITAFRYGWKGVTVFRELRRTYDDMYDIDYGIGTYTYWRSAMAQVLKWLPGVKDEREAGLEMLRRASTKGVYTRLIGTAMRMRAMLNEGMNDSALAVCEQMLRRFPQSVLFEEGRGRALFGLGRFDEAEGVFRRILARVEGEKQGSNCNAVITRYWLARTVYKLGRYASCIAECESMRSYKVETQFRRSLDSYLREARELQRDAQQRHAQAIGR